jgi:tripeptide aminopeptidase
VGLLGAANLDYGLLKSKEGLVLDHTAKPGKIVIGAPFLTDMEIIIKGRAAHASKPEDGISAIMAAVMALSRLKIGRIDRETTANVGIIEGGVISNGIPDKVLIRAEVRSHKQAKLEHQLELFRQAFTQAAAKTGASFDFKLQPKSLGYAVAKNDQFLRQIQRTFKRLGLETHGVKIGGASDANVFNQHGLKAIPIGSGGQRPHTTREELAVADLYDLADFLRLFVASC